MSLPVSAQALDEIMLARRSNRRFSQDIPTPDAVIERSLERAILAPNSSNMQLWQFVWVRSEEKRKELVPLCLGQNAAKTAAHLVVFVTRRDWWKRHAQWNLTEGEKDPLNAGHQKRLNLMRRYYGKLMPLAYKSDPLGLFSLFRKLLSFFLGISKPMMRHGGRGDQRVVLHKSCALAAQNFMLSVTAEGYDTCAMEGIDRIRMRKALGLPRQAEICMVIAVGKGTEGGIYGSRRRIPLEELLEIR